MAASVCGDKKTPPPRGLVDRLAWRWWNHLGRLSVGGGAKRVRLKFADAYFIVESFVGQIVGGLSERNAVKEFLYGFKS